MATKSWIGGAQSVAQISTITFSVYSASETYTLTINGKDVAFTATTGTNSDIWEGLRAAWEASDEPEHQEVQATVSSGVVLTSRTEGVPFTVSAAATTGSPTVTATQAATGPNHFSDANNWDGGVAPIAADDLLFANSDVDCLYDLEPALAFGEVIVERSFTGALGLARRNPAGYQEYRARYLKLTATAVIEIGSGDGNGSDRILIDANTQIITRLDVYSSGQGDGLERPVQIKNMAATSVAAVYGGRVAIEGSGGSASLAVVARDDASVAPDVEVAEGVAVGAVTVAGSNSSLHLYGTATSADVSGGARATIAGSATCPIVTASSGGVVNWDSSAGITTDLFVYAGGVCNFGRRNIARTVADAELHAGGTINDPLASITWTGGVELVGKIADVTLDLGKNRTVSV